MRCLRLSGMPRRSCIHRTTCCRFGTLGFRGEALPSIASVSRLTLETRAAEDVSGTVVEIAGGKIVRVEDAGMPAGTTIAVRDLFYNTPARRKFLKSEQTELAHIAALVTHYALAHPERHFELHSATQALLIAPSVGSTGDRLYQIFGRDTASLMLATTAEVDFARAGLPEPPPWKREVDYTRRSRVSCGSQGLSPSRSCRS